MKDKQKLFEDSDAEWSNFAWNAFFGGLPEPDELVDHETKNKLQDVYWSSRDRDDREPWGQNRSRAEVGPDQLNPDHILEAYEDLFKHKENAERAEKVLEQAINDETIPEYPRKIAQNILNIYEGVRDYQSIIEKRHDPENTVSYERIISPVEDKEYVSITEEDLDGLKSGDRQVQAGESIFFFLNTVDKNFQEYVEPEVEDAKMNVRAYTEGGELKVEVYDNGPGMDSTDQERLFMLGEGDNTGLPTANYVIEEHGGELEFYQPSNGGFGLRASLDISEN